MHLLLNLDYEMFGSGAGDVRRDITQPTSRVLNICEKYGAKMTIMFEVAEYWAFEQYASRLRERLGYSPAQQMRDQAIDAIRRGHDVQLHLHPQWIGAQYDKGVWQLCDSYWRLADLPDGLGSSDCITSITGALHKGKQTLESMIRSVKADYECVCFRAGAFYAQPSRDIITAMKNVGLRADSSIVRGYRKNAPFEVDYSRVETDKAVWWTTDTELTMEGQPGENIIELSVSSRMQPYWMSFSKKRLQAILKYRRADSMLSKGCTTNGSIRSVPPFGEILRRMVRRCPSIFDFCRLSSTDMLKRVKEHAKHLEQPMVAIGHSKDFINDQEFERFLSALGADERVSCSTFSEYIQKAMSRSHIPNADDTHPVNYGLSDSR